MAGKLVWCNLVLWLTTEVPQGTLNNIDSNCVFNARLTKACQVQKWQRGSSEHYGILEGIIKLNKWERKTVCSLTLQRPLILWTLILMNLNVCLCVRTRMCEWEREINVGCGEKVTTCLESQCSPPTWNVTPSALFSDGQNKTQSRTASQARGSN